jgi:hypothetical protein
MHTTEYATNFGILTLFSIYLILPNNPHNNNTLENKKKTPTSLISLFNILLVDLLQLYQFVEQAKKWNGTSLCK